MEIPTDRDAEGGTIAFDYIKSRQFRVIHIDGAMGGLTPSGLLHVGFYSERPAFPQRIVHEVTSEGQLGDLRTQDTISRGSIVRELDVDAVMTIATAKSLRDWLSQRIDEAAAFETTSDMAARKATH